MSMVKVKEVMAKIITSVCQLSLLLVTFMWFLFLVLNMRGLMGLDAAGISRIVVGDLRGASNVPNPPWSSNGLPVPVHINGKWACTVCDDGINGPNCLMPNLCHIHAGNGTIALDDYDGLCYCHCWRGNPSHSDEKQGPYCTTTKADAMNPFQPVAIGHRGYICDDITYNRGRSPPRLDWDMCSTSHGNRMVRHGFGLNGESSCTCQCDLYSWGRYCQHRSDRTDLTASTALHSKYCVDGDWIELDDSHGYCKCRGLTQGLMCDQSWSDFPSTVDEFVANASWSYECQSETRPGGASQIVPNLCRPGYYSRILAHNEQGGVTSPMMRCECACVEGYDGLHCHHFNGISRMSWKTCNGVGEITTNGDACFCGNNTLPDQPGVVWAGRTCSNSSPCRADGTMSATCVSAQDGTCDAFQCHCKAGKQLPFCT